ncbi:sulfur carrier protein ThiS [Jiella flava]|nr:sulfur carrier protein ThiS [Jiella flava]
MLNGAPTDIAAKTLADALAELGYDDGPFATALNREFVPAGERSATPLEDGDAVEVIAPMQGG